MSKAKCQDGKMPFTNVLTSVYSIYQRCPNASVKTIFYLLSKLHFVEFLNTYYPIYQQNLTLIWQSIQAGTIKGHIQVLELEDLKYRLQGASEYHGLMFNLSLSVTALSWLRAAAALWQDVILDFIDLTSTFQGPIFCQLSVNLLLFYSEPSYYKTTISRAFIWKRVLCGEILWTHQP